MNNITATGDRTHFTKKELANIPREFWIDLTEAYIRYSAKHWLDDDFARPFFYPKKSTLIAEAIVVCNTVGLANLLENQTDGHLRGICMDENSQSAKAEEIVALCFPNAKSIAN